MTCGWSRYNKFDVATRESIDCFHFPLCSMMIMQAGCSVQRDCSDGQAVGDLQGDAGIYYIIRLPTMYRCIMQCIT